MMPKSSESSFRTFGIYFLPVCLGSLVWVSAACVTVHWVGLARLCRHQVFRFVIVRVGIGDGQFARAKIGISMSVVSRRSRRLVPPTQHWRRRNALPRIFWILPVSLIPDFPDPLPDSMPDSYPECPWSISGSNCPTDPGVVGSELDVGTEEDSSCSMSSETTECTELPRSLYSKFFSVSSTYRKS